MSIKYNRIFGRNKKMVALQFEKIREYPKSYIQDAHAYKAGPGSLQGRYY